MRSIVPPDVTRLLLYRNNKSQMVNLLSRPGAARQGGDGRRPYPANGRRHAWASSLFGCDSRIDVVQNGREGATSAAFSALGLDETLIWVFENPVVRAAGFHRSLQSIPSDCRIVMGALRTPVSGETPMFSTVFGSSEIGTAPLQHLDGLIPGS
jgi:hypothetical protein